MGNFSMSFHLAAQTNMTTLRFIAEECAIFLSDKVVKKSVDLRRDYVCVVDFGLFELSLRTADKVSNLGIIFLIFFHSKNAFQKSGINPHIDLRASNDILHIRTCADSARALMQLLNYYASNGDLAEETGSVGGNGSLNSSPRHQSEPQLVNVEPQHFSNLSNSQHEQVNDLLGEAMKESYLERKGKWNGFCEICLRFGSHFASFWQLSLDVKIFDISGQLWIVIFLAIYFLKLCAVFGVFMLSNANCLVFRGRFGAYGCRSENILFPWWEFCFGGYG